MKIIQPSTVPAEPATSPLFTSEVSRQPILTPEMSQHFNSMVRPIRFINFPFPEFPVAYRAQSLTLAVAEYPPGPLTGVSADAEFPLRRHS